jgi:2-phospho-L-lactate guanylyltransferase
VVLPFRGVQGAKTRIAPVFTERQRARLAVSMLHQTLDAVDSSGVVDHALIVTREPEDVLDHVSITERRSVLRQPPDDIGLNAALDLGRDWAISHGFDAMLVLPGDLPTISASDVQDIVRASALIAIVPDRHHAGTNALLLRLCATERAENEGGRRFAFSFGNQSYRRHAEEAERLGLEIETLNLRGVAFDLDTPDDWHLLPIATRERLLAAMADHREHAPESTETLVALKGTRGL